MAVLPRAAKVALVRDYFQKAKKASHINEYIGKVESVKHGSWASLISESHGHYSTRELATSLLKACLHGGRCPG